MDLCGAPGPAASFSLPSHSPKALSRPGSSRHITVLAPAPAVSKSTHPLHRHSLEAPAGLPDLLPSPQNDFLQSRSGQATPLSPPPAVACTCSCPILSCTPVRNGLSAWPVPGSPRSFYCLVLLLPLASSLMGLCSSAGLGSFPPQDLCTLFSLPRALPFIWF